MPFDALRACCLPILTLGLVACAEDAAKLPPLDASMRFIDSSVPEPMDAEVMRELDACVLDAPQLAVAVVMHACLHGSDGPFRVVTGSASPDGAPDVSRAHTLFTVLAAQGTTAHVRYLPRASGEHVLFAAGGALIAAKQAQSSLAIEPRSVACAVLPTSYLMQLTNDGPVELTLRAYDARVALVIESLASWGSDSWVRACDAVVAPDAGSACRTSGSCSSDAECCSYCHDYDHCH